MAPGTEEQSPVFYHTHSDWLTINERGEKREDMKTYLAERWLKWEDSWHAEVLVKELGQIHGNYSTC